MPAGTKATMPTPRRTTRTDPAPGAPPRHLLGLQGLPLDTLRRLLTLARDFTGAPPAAPPLAGKTVATLFFEDSTRTRSSFTVAAQRVGAHVIDLSAPTSSITKGETLDDTALTIQAMGVDALIVRARQSGAAHLIARRVVTPVINAGDGRHEHPTQGLLDIMSLARAHGRLDTFDLKGLHVVIVGDVASSRVARSAIAGMTSLGAGVTCVGPASMAPRSLESLGVKVAPRLDDVVALADAVMMLRIQFERHDAGKTAGPAPASVPNLLPSIREYRAVYALTEERAARLKKGAVVMHPGPMNRGLEIDADVADSPRSLIRDQVATGVPVRMAALAWCTGCD